MLAKRIVLVVVAMVFLGFAHGAFATVVIGNLQGQTLGQGTTIDIDTTKAVAVTVDPSSPWQLTSFRAIVEGDNGPIDLLVRVHDYDGSDTPGAIVATVATVTVDAVGVYDFVPNSAIVLEAGTTYWFVMSTADIVSSGTWRTYSPQEAPADDIFSLVGYSISDDGGLFSRSRFLNAFEVQANKVAVTPAPAPVPALDARGVGILVLLLAGFAYFRRRSVIF
jgi:hypothetical protein